MHVSKQGPVPGVDMDVVYSQVSRWEWDQPFSPPHWSIPHAILLYSSPGGRECAGDWKQLASEEKVRDLCDEIRETVRHLEKEMIVSP